MRNLAVNSAFASARQEQNQASRPLKPSGVPWLGDIPAEWDVVRIKDAASLVTVRSDNNDHYIGLENVESGTGRFLPASDESFSAESSAVAIQEGDILFGKLRPYLAKCYLAEWDGCCSSEFLVLRTRKQEPRFLKYSLLSPTFIDHVNMSTYGTKMPRANWGIVGGAVAAFPPLPEQRAIADFLDEKCAAIDAIVEEAKAGIEEYAKWKKSLIFETVTGKNLPLPSQTHSVSFHMKSTGVPWIGSIPEVWGTTRLKFILARQLQYGANESGIDYNVSLPRYIRITDITLDGDLKTDGALSLSEESATDYILHDFDILLARSGATVGKAFLYLERMGRAAFAGYLIRASINEKLASPKFVYYTMLGSGYDNWRQSIAVSATIQNIGADKYNDYVIPLPPLPEQRAIAAYLDEKCASIDALIEEKKQLIEDLGVYKKSLIYETVTGKRKIA